VTLPARDGLEVDALRTDRYLEALLAAAERRAEDAPADAALDGDVRAAAGHLARALVRVHPSFRFEERLAVRLADAARSLRLAPAAGGEALPMPIGASLAVGTAGGPSDLDPLADPDDPDAPDLRPYLIGGAITSAALSLAGAAWVAWRRTHAPARAPMARAVRAARHARHARLPRGLS
jgi:hypothetical protein